jgi:membrane protein YqaA with SNARE-associated domain
MDAENSQAKVKPSKVRWYWILLAALLVAGMIASIVVLRHRIADFEHYGYLGAFLISIFASATIIAFIPSVPVIFALGGILNPFFVALAAATGETMGESTGYLAGRTGYAFFFKTRSVDVGKPGGIYPRLQRWVQTKGSLALFLSSAVFNPFFSVIGATAGALRFPAWKFYPIVWAGKMVKWMVVAMLGRALLVYILHWFGVTL